MIDTLVRLGFTKNDAEVYAALVKVGPCFVAPLVEETKKHRQIIYNALEAFISRNLVSVAQKNGKNFYSVSDPRSLLTELKEREVLAESLVREIETKQKSPFCPTCGKPLG